MYLPTREAASEAVLSLCRQFYTFLQCSTYVLACLIHSVFYTILVNAALCRTRVSAALATRTVSTGAVAETVRVLAAVAEIGTAVERRTGRAVADVAAEGAAAGAGVIAETGAAAASAVTAGTATQR
jgi:hypothetical protein